jgi:hypothetical protein
MLVGREGRVAFGCKSLSVFSSTTRYTATKKPVTIIETQASSLLILPPLSTPHIHDAGPHTIMMVRSQKNFLVNERDDDAHSINATIGWTNIATNRSSTRRTTTRYTRDAIEEPHGENLLPCERYTSSIHEDR